VLRVGDLVLNPATREVTRAGRPIALAGREYALLEYLLRNAGRVLSRSAIAQHVWGADVDSGSNTIDVYVGYLRRKIERAGEPRLIHTVRGVGYVVKAEP
jgi:two-component system response regulator MprA